MYTKQMREMGVEIVESIPELIAKVDVVLLEKRTTVARTWNRLSLCSMKKPVFVDKPIAGSLIDVIAIFEIARREGKVPILLLLAAAPTSMGLKPFAAGKSAK